jgi:hypothetical protein
MLDKATIALTSQQFIEAFRQLPFGGGGSVLDVVGRAARATHEEWEKRVRDLLTRIWASLEAHPVSDEDIDEEIRIVRAIRGAKQVTAASSH